MTSAETDYAALFAATPSPYLVLGPDLVITDVNDAYVEATGYGRADLLGRYVFDALPENPVQPDTGGAAALKASLDRVLSSRCRDTMAVQRYDIPACGRPGVFEERWWSMVNTPVLAPDGSVARVIHRAEDVTAFMYSRRRRSRPPPRPGPGGPPEAGPEPGRRLDPGAGGQADPTEWEQVMEAELYVRARELQRLNEQLRKAHAREREVALVLQNSMLHAPDLGRHPDVAVRYLPAVGSLNVCGDWYDLADLPGDRTAVAVGDVVGHGLEAASVMGMLRSALSAAIRAVPGPAQALEVLGLYARSVEGALAATAVQAVIDTKTRIVIYSSAGHPPPVLLHPDGSHELLDVATDPPLGARPEHVPRPQASRPYRPGDTLVLYTDGLIERRDEDIDAGLRRLTDALASCGRMGVQQLADTLLARLGVGGGGADDIALLAIRL
ncbi:SpoIIE family protein phosphatase [Streptacidiphilus sp. ASG 303]|uniref:SpoIIE family protein phosphatase n=1 Tax=Streptacidiphilus sp. ASG 303 TaxID=2896847 RepID=UPI001E492DEB|nr:SpoIIE family protein phosphatase [Streptacidiphilus sp. ASG 303]MCD0481077.1 SpoIIE family protein phosphatase [Streptacidiphilus sp. ASG 303]